MNYYFEFISVRNAFSNERAPNILFNRLIQRAILLGLKENGFLNEIQFRNADKNLMNSCNQNITNM